jgi:hypothetical protein
MDSGAAGDADERTNADFAASELVDVPEREKV